MDFLVGIAAQTPALWSSFEGYGESWKVFAAIESDTGLYGKVGYEDGRFRLFGQPWYGAKSVTAGAGYRFDLSETFSLRLEGGWWEPVETRIVPAIRDEIAFNYLVDKHHFDGLKPIPLPQVTTNVFGEPMPNYAPCNDWGGEFFPDECYDSEGRIEGNFYAEVGGTAKIAGGFELDVSYRYLRPDSFVAIFHPATREAGGGWWQDEGFLRGDSMNFSVTWRF